MVKSTFELINALEDFETMSDFYDDTEAVIIRRFYVLNKQLNEENNKNVSKELQRSFGDFLVNKGNDFIKSSKE